MDREVMHLRDSFGVKFAENVYYGFWFAPEFELMRKIIDETATSVSTGDVRVKLYRGNVIVVERRFAKFTLRRANCDLRSRHGLQPARDAEGFIKLNALRLRLGGASEGQLFRGEAISLCES